MPSARVIGVGAFVLGGLLLFAVGLFMIGERRMLFEKQVEVSTEFKRLAGLQNGSTVRVSGMDAGEVTEIKIPKTPAEKFRVKMRLRKALHPLIRTDSLASIQTDGLVGNQFLQIEVGTEGAPRVPEGGTIRGAEPFDLNALLQQAGETVKMVNQTVTELRGDVEVAIKSVSNTAVDANRLINDVSVDVKAMTRSGARIVADTQAVVTSVREGRGTLGKLVNDDELHGRVARITKDAERTVQNVRESSEELKLAVKDFRSKEGPAQGIATDLRQTLSFTREAMSDIAENAQALKRNFLFRGFFNKRGYFDLQELSAAEYRAGALEQGGRLPLRIWLDAKVLFETTPDGTETLTDGGRARLDSTMSEFVRHPRDSPLVVEGYATGDTNDVRYLRARARADAVLQYLRVKYAVDPHRVGLIVMGSEAKGSPAGETWDGVALTLFVQKSVAVRDVASAR